jgi:hypothetical protein
MDLEQQLRDSYDDHLGGLDLPPGDLSEARRTGSRMRTRRRLTVLGAAVAVVAVAVGGSLVGTGRVSIDPSHGAGSWRELPAPPLSPRADAVSAWTGREVIVLGGDPDPCPPNADCADATSELRDGAAYDPATNAWRNIADAPVPVGPGDRLLAADGQLVLRHFHQGGSDWFVYDPAADDWSPIPGVPKGIGDLPSSFGSDVYAMARGHVVTYSVARGVWSTLPADPITPRLAQRRVTATPNGPVVTGYDSTQPQDGTVANPVIADAFDGTAWHRLPATKILGNDWSWTGDRMIDFDSFAHQGISPLPGVQLGGQLDLSTGRSGPLPASALETPEDPWSPVAIGPGRWAVSWGLVYDVATGQARTLPRPDGAPDLGTTAVWAGDRLVVFGGATFGEQADTSSRSRAWLWTP